MQKSPKNPNIFYKLLTYRQFWGNIRLINKEGTMKKEYTQPEVTQLLLSRQDIVTASSVWEKDITEQDVGWDSSLFSAN